MTTRRRLAANAVSVLAWVLLVVVLSVIALNPFVLSVLLPRAIRLGERI